MKEIEENTEESGDEDSFESDSDSTEDEASGDNDHFDLDYTHQEDVRTVVETMMTARRTHRNRMHAYFKKFPSKEAALLKPHPDTTKNSGRSYAICSPASIYASAFINFDTLLIYSKARDEIEAMRAAREKDLQEFAKKQAEMEATLRDHREEQWVGAHPVGAGGAHEKGARVHASGARGAHAKEQERMRKEQERLRAEISKELEKKMSSVMEKKMSDMSKTIQPVWGFKKVDAYML
ncbi:hypothetical protein CJ030_MR6G004344 [Morella rubra]|uniref:Uncharacterized protein n=1 Tax=Morella rubra TaxID=262757 RepID=A0A6A1VAG1_9ROSI|nr:hypothetical protein CJ030_MR6G004344 [Morella rubra]